jgi:CBS domain-containing protein
MAIGEFCNREVIISNRNDTVLEVAKLMRKYHVGDVVVVEERGDKQMPVGIITDRDIVIELVALEVDTTKILVGDAMNNELLTVNENEQLTDLVQKMQGKAVRRVPVVDDSGALVGIVTADDIIDLIAEQLNSLVGMVQREQHRERRTRVVS